MVIHFLNWMNLKTQFRRYEARNSLTNIYVVACNTILIQGQFFPEAIKLQKFLALKLFSIQVVPQLAIIETGAIKNFRLPHMV